MPALIWSPAALRDVQRLYRFLSEKNVGAARRAAAAIRSGMTLLTSQPSVGRPAEGMDTEYREWPIPFGDSGYIALYRNDGQRVVVLAVRHQREAGY